jgi:hypothetical protein
LQSLQETIHWLLTVALPEKGASQNTIVNVQTCLSAMLHAEAFSWRFGGTTEIQKEIIGRGLGLTRKLGSGGRAAANPDLEGGKVR